MFDAMPHPTAAELRRLPEVRSELPGGPVTTFMAGAEIFAEGDQAGVLYQVAFGVVRVYRLLACGRRQICAFHMAGDVFGFEPDIERHMFADAVTVTGLRTLRTARDPELTRELFTLALRSLNRAHDHLLTVGRNDAGGRVAAFLLDLADRHGGRGGGVIDIPMSRTDIGDYLGLTIETVSRVLTRLKEAKIIRLESSRRIAVCRWDALEAMTY